jgi:hypothetical protein
VVSSRQLARQRRTSAGGSLDEDSFDRLMSLLVGQAPAGEGSPCRAFYASLPAGDFDSIHLWRGPLRAVADLFHGREGSDRSSPTNLW